MWIRDWLDTVAVIGWIGIWALLIYVLPLAGV